MSVQVKLESDPSWFTELCDMNAKLQLRWKLPAALISWGNIIANELCY